MINEFGFRGETVAVVVVVTIIIVFCSVFFLSAFAVGYISSKIHKNIPSKKIIKIR